LLSLPKLSAAATAILALIVLGGWTFSVPLLKSLLPGAVEMKANTAMGLLSAAASLFILSNRPSLSMLRLSQALALAVVILGLATLGEYLFKWDLGIDEFLFRDTANAFNAIRGRMSPLTTLLFALLGLSLAASPKRSLRPMVLVLAITVVALGAMISVGYLWNASELVTDSWLPPVALNTSLALSLLGAGLFYFVLAPEHAQGADTQAERKVIAGFLVAFALLIISCGFAYRASNAYQSSADRINRALRVRIQAGQLYNRISDIESAARSYILTGKQSYKDEYRRVVDEIDANMQELNRLLKDDPAQSQKVADIWPMIATRIQQTDQQMAVYDKQGELAAKALIAAEDGRLTLREMRTPLRRLADAEVQLVDNQQATMEHNRRLTLTGLFATLLIAMAIFVSLFMGIRREMGSKTRARQRVQETATRLSSILDTVADGIITIDDSGLIESFNQAAERLFGYAATEIVGRNVSTLMPEPYRASHDGFISHYLATGEKRIIGVGREVVALRKDGTTFEMSLAVCEMWLAGKRHFTGIVSDITDRKRNEQNLIASKEQADLANRAKDSFLATMSHEIRTPLTGLLGMLELLSMTRLDGEQAGTLRTAWNSAKGLLRIVNDILDWSKIQEGKLQLDMRPTNITQLLQEVINTYSRVASAKSLTLKYSADPRLGQFHVTDPLRLSQVLNIFVSNAIKFTDNGAIELRAELLERVDGRERIRFSVSDTGIGIARDVQGNLFERYRQVGADTARLYGGTGLGLAICRRLAELMEGQVNLRSEVGHGSTFTITLALDVCAAPEHELRYEADTAFRDTIRFSTLADSSMPLILAVDDHPINRNLLASQIKTLGLQAETAENGLAALAKWRNGGFAMVITDCHMPQMDGYALTREIRRIEAEQGLVHVPVVAWTANALAEESDRCTLAGIDDLLVKPANLSQLTRILAKYLAHETKEKIAQRVAPGVTVEEPGSPIDFTVLAQIVPDREAQHRAMRRFRKHLRIDRVELGRMQNAGAFADLEGMAHRMKGSALMIGAARLASSCADMERAAGAGNVADIADARAALDAAVAQLESYLTEIGIEEELDGDESHAF